MNEQSATENDQNGMGVMRGDSTERCGSGESRRAFLGKALLAVAAVSETEVSSAASAQESDEAEIRHLYESLMAAVKREDVAGVVGHYAPQGFIYLDVSIPRAYYGIEGATKTWKAWFDIIEHGSGGGEATDLKITVAGHHAFAMHFDHYWATPKDPKLQQLRDFTNRATSWLEKINGKWYILVEHNSFPLDLLTGLGDFKSKA